MDYWQAVHSFYICLQQGNEMTGFFDIFNIDGWRNLVKDFDVKHKSFVDNLNRLKTAKGATPELEARRQSLISEANPIAQNISRLRSSLQTVRSLLANTAGFFNFGSNQPMGDLGFPPVIIGIGLAAAAAIVSSITNWLTKTAKFAADNNRAQLILDAGGDADQVAKAGSLTPGSSAKIFGFDIRWLLAVGGLVIVGPFILKKLR